MVKRFTLAGWEEEEGKGRARAGRSIARKISILGRKSRESRSIYLAFLETRRRTTTRLAKLEAALEIWRRTNEHIARLPRYTPCTSVVPLTLETDRNDQSVTIFVRNSTEYKIKCL